tara:strand:- start:1646 stop:2956 length:1311 start_codon:yes stop_codon:yes gene_type:complete
MKKNKKIVYIALSGHIIHHGHINLIKSAQKYGKVILGLMTDKAIAGHRRIPILNWEQRKKILSSIDGISKVVPQNEWDYTKNLTKIDPDYMVHGDDWKKGPDKELREKVINLTKKIKCKLIEIPHTKGISGSNLINRMSLEVLTATSRTGLLKKTLSSKGFIRILEVHSPLSALIAEKASVIKKGQRLEYDGFWSSSLTDSTLRGKPDIEVVELNQRLQSINDIFDVTSKPLIMDVDTGGQAEHFEINVSSIERLGVSSIIVEDKKGLKKNSLFGNTVKQEQDSIKSFCNKIKLGKRAKKNKDFMIIARIESLILGKGINDAYKRADNYLASGADGIMIHSKDKNPIKIFKFANYFKKKYPNIPLVVAPTTFNQVYENRFRDTGINIVIYANHLLRAAIPAMQKVAYTILENQRSSEAKDKIMSIKEILNLIPGTK